MCVPGTSSGSEMSTSLEQEKYFSAVVTLTPMGNQRFPGGGSMRPTGPLAATSSNHSLTSIDSLLLCHTVAGDLLLGGAGDLSLGDSVLRGRGRGRGLSGPSPLARAVSNLRSGGVKAKCKHLQGPGSPCFSLLYCFIISGDSISHFSVHDLMGNCSLKEFLKVS